MSPFAISISAGSGGRYVEVVADVRIDALEYSLAEAVAYSGAIESVVPSA